jgi:hypothetical protein
MKTLKYSVIGLAWLIGFACQGLYADCLSAPPGLVSWWRAENNALDQAGTNHGTILSGTTFAPGQVGQAFNFDASATSGLVIPSSPTLNPTEAITLEAWVNPSSYPNTGPAIVRKDLNTVGTTQYSLNIGDGITAGVAHCSIGLVSSVTGGLVPTNQWSHVAGTYDRQMLRLYVNGIEVASAPATAPIPTSSQNLGIGKEDPFLDRSFAGLMDEISIYNRALSAAEIQSIVTAGAAGKCLSLGPELRIVAATPGFATISWTPPTPGFVLQESLSLPSIHWTNSPSGTNNPVTVPATSPANFFRLAQP